MRINRGLYLVMAYQCWFIDRNKCSILMQRVIIGHEVYRNFNFSIICTSRTVLKIKTRCEQKFLQRRYSNKNIFAITRREMQVKTTTRYQFIPASKTKLNKVHWARVWRNLNPDADGMMQSVCKTARRFFKMQSTELSSDATIPPWAGYRGEMKTYICAKPL